LINNINNSLIAARVKTLMLRSLRLTYKLNEYPDYIMSGFEGFIPESNQILQLNYISTIKPLGGKRSFLPQKLCTSAHILIDDSTRITRTEQYIVLYCGVWCSKHLKWRRSRPFKHKVCSPPPIHMIKLLLVVEVTDCTLLRL
jgi:hypothetical protein